MTTKYRWLRRSGIALAFCALAQFGAGCGSEITVLNGNTGGSGATSSGSGAETGSSVVSTGVTGGNGSSGTGGVDWTQCNTSSECGLVAQTCCGVCNQPTLEDMTSINQMYDEDYRMSVCGDPPPPCPGCAGRPNANLYAYCDSLGVGAGNCVAADVSETKIGECKSDSDCRLRFGLGCCEACFGEAEDLVAINGKQEELLKKQVCDPDYLGCPDCAPQYPLGAAAFCEQGRCVVDALVGPGG